LILGQFIIDLVLQAPYAATSGNASMDIPVPPPPVHVHQIERRSVADMIGEILRECGVLLVVFIPLDLALQGHPLTTPWVVAIVVLPATLMALGISIERSRRQ
jgi:hypothetical protein